MNRARTTLLGIAFAVTLPATLLGQVPEKVAAPKPPTTKVAAAKPKPETQAQLQKAATVSLKDATATALAQVPGGKVTSHELEREKGKLIYSFDIKVAGKSGIEEVAVDAMTGAMIEKVHETPADEAKEKAADKKAAAAAKKPVTPPAPPAPPTPPVRKP